MSAMRMVGIPSVTWQLRDARMSLRHHKPKIERQKHFKGRTLIYLYNLRNKFRKSKTNILRKIKTREHYLLPLKSGWEPTYTFCTTLVQSRGRRALSPTGGGVHIARVACRESSHRSRTMPKAVHLQIGVIELLICA